VLLTVLTNSRKALALAKPWWRRLHCRVSRCADAGWVMVCMTTCALSFLIKKVKEGCWWSFRYYDTIDWLVKMQTTIMEM
jgi:hypothetical protein